MVLLQQLLESQQRSFSAETDDFWWMLSAARKSVPACSAKSQRERQTDRQRGRQIKYITVIIAFVVVMLSSSSSLEFNCWQHVLCERTL